MTRAASTKQKPKVSDSDSSPFIDSAYQGSYRDDDSLIDTVHAGEGSSSNDERFIKLVRRDVKNLKIERRKFTRSGSPEDAPPLEVVRDEDIKIERRKATSSGSSKSSRKMRPPSVHENQTFPKLSSASSSRRDDDPSNYGIGRPPYTPPRPTPSIPNSSRRDDPTYYGTAMPPLQQPILDVPTIARPSYPPLHRPMLDDRTTYRLGRRFCPPPPPQRILNDPSAYRLGRPSYPPPQQRILNDPTAYRLGRPSYPPPQQPLLGDPTNYGFGRPSYPPPQRPVLGYPTIYGFGMPHHPPPQGLTSSIFSMKSRRRALRVSKSTSPKKGGTITPIGDGHSFSYTPAPSRRSGRGYLFSSSSVRSASSKSSLIERYRRSLFPEEQFHAEEIRHVVEEGTFRDGELRERDGEEEDDKEVIRPSEYEDAEIDRADSVKSGKGKNVDPPILSGLANLNRESHVDEEREAWSLTARAEKMSKRRSQGNVQKRSLAKNIGSDTDKKVNEALSLKTTFGWHGEGSTIDDPPVIEEVDEKPKSCEEQVADVAMERVEEDDDWEVWNKEVPYYERDYSSLSEALYKTHSPGFTPLRERSSETEKVASFSSGLESSGEGAQIPRSHIGQDTLHDSEIMSRGSSTVDSTGASFSEDVTDWGEDSDMENYMHRLDLGDYHIPGDSENRPPLFTLEPMKKEMVDRLMEEFWIIFNEKWPAGARQCPSAPKNSSSTSRSISGTSGPRRTASRGNSASRKDGDREGDENADEASGNDPGGKGKGPESRSSIDPNPGFACPYRKRDPRKYCVGSWRSCALSPFKTVARVKGHLYRHHIIHQCQRCKGIFTSDEELDSHIETSERCDAILASPVDGITRKMKSQLQCKRKAFPGQTEAERWKQVYQILFPEDEEVPDPYFEPVRDNEESAPLSPNLADLGNYEDYLRRTLPRLVRSALETEVNNEIQPIEERLRGQILGVIEQAQSRAFLEYRAMMGTNHSSGPSVDSGYVSNQSRSSSSRDSGVKRPVSNLSGSSSISSTVEPGGALQFPGVTSSQFIGRDPTPNVEPIALEQQSTRTSSALHPVPWTVSDESLPLEADYLSNPLLFADQAWDTIPDNMDVDSFNWELEETGGHLYE